MGHRVVVCLQRYVSLICIVSRRNEAPKSSRVFGLRCRLYFTHGTRCTFCGTRYLSHCHTIPATTL